MLKRSIDDLKSLSIYVHVPFCTNKCGYCDFNSWAETRRGPQEAWAKSLLAEIDLWAGKLGDGHRIDTLFFGGGTPSLIGSDLLAQVVSRLEQRFDFGATRERTIECNPETLTADKLLEFSSMGFDRLSMGVQSFVDEHLIRLERQARRTDNERSLELVAKNWPGRWSLDLMFGLPKQSLEDWAQELKTAMKFGPQHLSAYQLTLTTERSKNWAQPVEDSLLEMFELAENFLGKQGLARYEVSNFAKPGHESLHNSHYWTMDSFLGLGPGAASFMGPEWASKGFGDFGSHFKNPDRFEAWSTQVATGQVPKLESLSQKQLREEIFMMGLRLKSGFDGARLGWSAGTLNAMGEKFQSALLIDAAGRVRATPDGLKVLDSWLPKIFEFVGANP
jgi:oxygen-independent coproporphyrinogen-3 oxidase